MSQQKNEHIHKICVYGTLRVHEQNYHRIINTFGQDAYRYKSRTSIPGYIMYDLTWFPAVVNSKNIEDVITVELFDCNYDAYYYIKNMEANAGYYEELVCIDYVFYSIFVMIPSDISPKSKLIDSGDWSQYIQEMSKLNY